MGGGCSQGRQTYNKVKKSYSNLTGGSLKRIEDDELEDQFADLQKLHTKLTAIEAFVNELRKPAARGPFEKLEEAFSSQGTQQERVAFLGQLREIRQYPETHITHLHNVEILLTHSKEEFDRVAKRMNDRRAAWQERQHYRSKTDRLQRQASSKVAAADSLPEASSKHNQPQGLASNQAKLNVAEANYDVKNTAAEEALKAFSAEQQDREISKIMSELCNFYAKISVDASQRVEEFQKLAMTLTLHSAAQARPFKYWTSAPWHSGVLDIISASVQESRALAGMCKLASDFGGKDHKSHVNYNALKFFRAWRIENYNLWRRYETEKEMIRSQLQKLRTGSVPTINLKADFQEASKKLNSELDLDVNEVYLAHGTAPQNIMKILQNGLNEHFSGGLFGQGSYLAEDFAKCDQYCIPDVAYADDGELKALHSEIFDMQSEHGGNLIYIILCRALLGYFVCTKDAQNKISGTGTIWSKQNRELALIEDQTDKGIHYHALVAETGAVIKRFREFVLYHGARVYPEYLIAVQRVS